MTCNAALERMLEAAPDALRGGDEELARHLAACPRCAAVVSVLMRETDALDRELDLLSEQGGAHGPAGMEAASAAAEAALSASRERSAGERPHGEGGTVVSLPEHRARVGRPAWTRRAWVPLAAAAALAAVFVLGQRNRFPTAPSSGAVPSAQPRVSVTPPTDRGAAIMETENPNITIVWLYEREES